MAPRDGEGGLADRPAALPDTPADESSRRYGRKAEPPTPERLGDLRAAIEGAVACCGGWPLASNPFDPYSAPQLWKAWALGWEDALVLDCARKRAA